MNLVSVIVPARNEEAVIGACLASLVAQEGVAREIIVVNDGSTDATRRIAERCAQSCGDLVVIDAPPPPPNTSGKCNAADAGARAASGEWLLFTDADTVHAPGALAAAVAEAAQHGVALLSYEPRQDVRTWWERATMGVIFAELNRAFPLADVSDPRSAPAAANGQYILISREAYDAVGGFAAFAHTLLEDVALARAVKRAGYPLHFRHAGERVSTRMYTGFSHMRDGWSKNLAALFPNARSLAVARAIEFVLAIAMPGIAVVAMNGIVTLVAACAAAVTWSRLVHRIRRARFDWRASILAPVGLLLFAYLLVRSHRRYRAGAVMWKDRSYAPATPSVELL